LLREQQTDSSDTYNNVRLITNSIEKIARTAAYSSIVKSRLKINALNSIFHIGTSGGSNTRNAVVRSAIALCIRSVKLLRSVLTFVRNSINQPLRSINQ